jgi:hypothetical protein
MKVRHNSAMKGGVSIKYRSDNFLSATAMAPKRDWPSASLSCSDGGGTPYIIFNGKILKYDELIF